MPHPPKVMLNRTVLFVTSRTEEGLPFVCTPEMKIILLGILARAQALYHVRVVAIKFMANHFHMILIVDNPEDIPAFIDRVKTESAHAVNLLLGRRKKTVWVDGYDSAVLLTPEDVIEKLAYIYTNPQKASLVDTIEDYPGVSTWKMFQSKITSLPCPWITRPNIPDLADNIGSLDSFIKERKLQIHELILYPMSWLECFDYPMEKETAREQLISRVRQLEAEYRATRKGPVVGAARLRKEVMNTTYVPQTHGRRMLCISWDVELRIRFILFVKELRAQAREVLAKWRKGFTNIPFPSGLFPPSLPKLSNLLPSEAF